VDLSKLNTTDKVIAGSGLLLFIASFLPWFGKGPFDGNGWDVGFLWGGIPALLGLLAALVVLGVRLGDMKMPELPATTGQIMLGAGAISALLVVLKLLIGYKACGFNVCVHLDRKIGLFLAAIAAIGLLYGGFQAYREEQAGRSAI
jgi:hypothetical protein